MNAAAVIVRELRAESRRAANYWLRVLAAAVLLAVFASIMLSEGTPASRMGVTLFWGVTKTFTLALWILVPLMTADCVSRERREGTLGLLFLTPLTVFDVIAGKATVHVLRALTLFLAATPLLGLPLVLGGVDWRWVLMATVMQADAVLLGIAAGIYASTRGGSTIQVMVMAETTALVLACISALGSSMLVAGVAGRVMAFTWLVEFLGASFFCSLGLFFLLIFASVSRLRATWQDEAPTTEQPRWVEHFSSSEFWRSFFRWNTSRTLDCNPMAWLQEYSWTARLTKWGWLLLVLVVEFLLLTNSIIQRSSSGQPLVTVALGLGIAFSAVGSFRREQETGLLELLLVTPLTVRQLLGGRFWGICCHYLPALAVLWVGWIGDRMLNPDAYRNRLVMAMAPYPLSFVVMVVLGLYLSLARLNFFLAWLLTWSIAFAVPAFARTAAGRFALADSRFAFGPVWLFQLALVVLIWFLLQRKVREREFAVVKGERHLGV